MDGFWAEALGIAAGTLTTSSFVPQVLRTWRTRSTRDISCKMYLIMCAGIALWIVYGVLINSLSVVVANGASLLLTGSILAMKVLFERGAHGKMPCEHCGRT